DRSGFETAAPPSARRRSKFYHLRVALRRPRTRAGAQDAGWLGWQSRRWRVHGVIDEVSISSGDELADALDSLPPADLRIHHEGRQGRKNSIAHGQRSGRVPAAKIIGDSNQIGCGPRREAQ